MLYPKDITTPESVASLVIAYLVPKHYAPSTVSTHIYLNVKKTKKMLIDFRKTPTVIPDLFLVA